MLVKSLGAKSKGAVGRLIDYVTRDSAVVKDRYGQTIIIKHNITGNSLAELKKVFALNEANRLQVRKQSNMALHEILSFSRLDTERLNPEILDDLTRYYLSIRAEKGMGIATFHQDKEHQHVHIVLGGVEIVTGKSLRISRSEFQKFKIQLQEYQQSKYGNLESVVEHGKGSKEKTSNAEYQMKARTGLPSRKDTIKDILKAAFDKSLSPDDFYSNISEQGLSLYERGKHIGIEGDRNYRLETLGYGVDRIRELEVRAERTESLQDLEGHNEPEQELIQLVQRNKEKEYENLDDTGKTF